MEPATFTPESIHAFTEHYINACSPYNGPFNLPKEDQKRMAYILAAALDTIREKSKLESRWCQAQLYSANEHLAHYVDTNMEKTGARCLLTMYAGSVTMAFTLPHINELPSMDNAFWSDLTGIITRHKLTYSNGQIHEAVSKSEANKAISKFVKAPLFAFLTDFHIAYQHDPKGAIRLGEFDKSIFFMDSTWPEIVTTLTEIFRDLTRLARRLYRSYYIKASKDPKRRLGVADFETVRKIFSWIAVQSKAWTPEDAAAAFPKATKIDIQAAHDLAMERDLISGTGKPFRIFSPTDPKE